MTVDASVVRRFYQAVADRDASAAQACFTPDATWHLPGSSAIAGDYVGGQAIWNDFLGKLAPLSDGTFRAELLDVAIGDTFVVAVQHATGQARGKSLDITGCQLMRIDDTGHITDVRGHYSDEAALDAFWLDDAE